MQDRLNSLIIGDLVGLSALRKIYFELSKIIKREKVDFVVVNAENVNNGFGITEETASMLFKAGVNVITTGNHVYNSCSSCEFLINNNFILRPHNFSSNLPGFGFCFYKFFESEIAVINLQGYLQMHPFVQNPFESIKKLLPKIRSRTNNIFLDFHAESNYEKEAMGHFLNGSVTACIGTHTHIATADERILDKGTAYISDVGMTGCINSVIGFDFESSLYRALTFLPKRNSVVEENISIQGVLVSSNLKTGKALEIKRVKYS